MKTFATVILPALLLAAGCTPTAPDTADVVIRDVAIVDVEHARAIPGQAVVLRGNDIVAVGPDAEIAPAWEAASTIDGAGQYLIPGLWDMHVHFGGGPELIEENEALFPLYVAHGITAIRDASGDLPDQVLEWRRRIAEGELQGPRLFTSGAKIEGLDPAWKGTIEVGSEADVDAAFEKLRDDDVDFVKITDSTLEPSLFLYAVEKGKSLGMRTSGHIPMALTVEQAVDTGLSSIEHIGYAFNAGAKDEAEIAAAYARGELTRAEAGERLQAGFDPETAMAAYRNFAAKGVYVTPTLNGSRIIAWLDADDHADDDDLAYIGPKLRDTYTWRVERASQASPEEVAERHARFEQRAALLPMLQEAGVTIMAGTDAGFLNSYNYPGIGLHDELALFVDKGLTPTQALASATRAGPAWFGLLDRYGSIEKGKAADLVLLRQNPLDDIAATREISTVIMQGEVFGRAALDAMLDDTRRKVAAWDAEHGE